MQLKVVRNRAQASAERLDQLGPRLAGAIRAEVAKLVQRAGHKRAVTDAENVHQMRVSTRKIRSYLKAFRKETGPTAGQLDHRLRDLQKSLGSLRDLDVQLERWREENEVVTALQKSREALREALASTLASTTFAGLISSLRTLAQAVANNPALSRPFESALTDTVRTARRQSWRKAKRLGMLDPSLEFHALRRSAKQLRYLTELGPESRKRAKVVDRLKELQDVLGERQDAVTADHLLLDLTDQLGEASRKLARHRARDAEREEPKLRRKILKQRSVLRKRAWRAILG